MADENTPFNRAMGLAVAECTRLNNTLVMNRADDLFWMPSQTLYYIAGKSGRVGSQMEDLQGLTGDADMADAICLFNGNMWVPSVLGVPMDVWVMSIDVNSKTEGTGQEIYINDSYPYSCSQWYDEPNECYNIDCNGKTFIWDDTIKQDYYRFNTYKVDNDDLKLITSSIDTAIKVETVRDIIRIDSQRSYHFDCSRGYETSSDRIDSSIHHGKCSVSNFNINIKESSYYDFFNVCSEAEVDASGLVQALTMDISTLLVDGESTYSFDYSHVNTPNPATPYTQGGSGGTTHASGYSTFFTGVDDPIDDDDIVSVFALLSAQNSAVGLHDASSIITGGSTLYMKSTDPFGGADACYSGEGYRYSIAVHDYVSVAHTKPVLTHLMSGKYSLIKAAFGGTLNMSFNIASSGGGSSSPDSVNFFSTDASATTSGIIPVFFLVKYQSDVSVGDTDLSNTFFYTENYFYQQV